MKNITIGIIIGVCATVTALHIWYLYSLNSRITVLENFASSVTTLIRQSQPPAATK